MRMETTAIHYPAVLKLGRGKRSVGDYQHFCNERIAVSLRMCYNDAV